MRAGSSFTNFVTDGNVRQNAQTFNPDLFNKVGAITGYPGPSNSIAAAAGDLGGKIVMKGGRSPAPGPNYHSFEDSAELRDGTYGKNYAPVKSCNNNQCGGRKMKKNKSMKKKHAMKKHKSMKKKHTIKKKTRKPLSLLEDVRDLFKMRGGEPASVPPGTTSNGYHQYMSNNAQSNIYGLDGNLSPSENALANPMKIKVANACA